jgi:demethylmenaquinone methyltransferase/2-methoxy-6-polyprenyl-1,4-benzoquinol methylase
LAQADLLEYYRRRAAEYEAIFHKPERQADLRCLKTTVSESLRGRNVLELACGTGYWTSAMAPSAASVLATDLGEEPMSIARGKRYPPGKVRFAEADAYALGPELGRFDAAFAGFWWSHVPVERLVLFLAGLHARLSPGARVVFLDNRYVEGSSTPISERDAAGNTYQVRKLADGSSHRVLKNFPSKDDLHRRLDPLAAHVAVETLQYYWLVDYRLP